jgi:hypothetical protein
MREPGHCRTASRLKENPIMINDSMNSRILAREERAIERLAHETHTAIAKVQEIFLIEYEKLSVGAHIKSFLPLLAGNSVRVILDRQNAGIDCVSKP